MIQSATIPQPYRAVFFDWDGTLVESMGFLQSAHNHVRAHLGMPLWDTDEYMRHMKYSSGELYPMLYGDRADDAFSVLERFMTQNHLQNISIMDGAAELLETLFSAGIVMGVVSNKRHAFLTREIEHLGWGRYFASIVGAGVAAKDKPAADPLILSLDRAGQRPGRDVLYVGDTITDLLCAAAAGCSSAFLYAQKPDNLLIQQHNPDIAVENCKFLLSRLFPDDIQYRYIR